MAMLGAPCSKCCDNCQRRSCFWLQGPSGFEQDGDCEDKEGCCCEQDPEGGCFDPSILDENGEITVPVEDQILRGYCLPCCVNEVVFSILANNQPPNDPNDRPRSEAAAEWIATVAAWLEANGYVNVSTYNVVCGKGSDGLVNNVVWVRACCDGAYIEDTDECYGTLDAAPADSFGMNSTTLVVQGSPGNNPCANVQPAGTYIPACDPNPLP